MRCFLTCLLVTLSSASAAADNCNLSIDELLERYVESRGGHKALEEQTALRLFSTNHEGKWNPTFDYRTMKPGYMWITAVYDDGYVAVEESPAELPLVIPASAPLITGTRAVVYVELPDAEEPTYEGREIVLGPRAGDWYLVRHGLEEGERVVTRGNFKIDSALQLQAKPSMMTPEGGAPPAGHDNGGHGGGAEAVRADFEFFGSAGSIEGSPDQLKSEDFWYLEPLNRALDKLGRM